MAALALYLEATFVPGMNPKPILFFTALFPQFLNAAEPLLPQFFILTGIFMGLSLPSLLAYGLLARRARRAGSTGPWIRYSWPSAWRRSSRTRSGNKKGPHLNCPQEVGR